MFNNWEKQIDTLAEDIKIIISKKANVEESNQIQESSQLDEVNWPDAGIQFLKKVHALVSKQLPFSPESVSQDDEIEGKEPCAWWYVKGRHYVQVSLGGKRRENVEIECGLYTDVQKRDPLFRANRYGYSGTRRFS